MTYSRNKEAPPPTRDEVTYSPFVPADLDTSSSLMGTYEVFGTPASVPAFPAQMTGYRAPAIEPIVYVPPMEDYSMQPPPGYRLVPLSGEGSSRGMTRGQKVVAALVVIGIVAAIIYLVRKNKKEAVKEKLTPTQAVKKLPTSRLAQNLYQRLARNGKGTRGMLKALDELSQES